VLYSRISLIFVEVCILLVLSLDKLALDKLKLLVYHCNAALKQSVLYKVLY